MAVKIKSNVKVEQSDETRTVRQADGSDLTGAPGDVTLTSEDGTVTAVIPAVAYKELFEEEEVSSADQEDPGKTE